MGLLSTSLENTEQALLDSEHRLQQVLDNSGAVVYAKDNRGRYLFINREFERLTRRPSQEIVGRTDEEIFPPELAERFRNNDLRVLLEKRSYQFEEEGDFGNGQQTFLSCKFPLLDSANSVYAVCGMSTDISDRKRMEEAFSAAALAVSQSEEETLYRQLARYLSTILSVECAFIAAPVPGRPSDLRMLALHLDGEVRENFDYPAAGTPCETVVGHGFRLYPSRLPELFPGNEEFRKLGLQSYAGQPLTDAGGRSTGLVGIMSRRPFKDPALVEMTLRVFAVRINAEIERADAATRLRASEANYREIFEASEDAIFVHDWDSGAVVDVNTRACEAFGYTREQCVGMSVGELTAGAPPFTEADALGWIEQAKRDGSVSFEWLRRRQDGSLHWLEVCLKRAQIGGQMRVLAFAKDITGRKQANEALRASEEQYRAVFNASADALVLWNSRYERVDVNPAYERMYGYGRDEVISGVRSREIPESHRQQQAEIIARTLAGERFHGEIQTIRRNGEPFPIEVRTIPIRHRGEPHVLAMIRDLTEQRRAEREQARLEAQLRQAQKMEAIGQLAGGIAHDFNNLLTSIMGYVALAGGRDAAIADRRMAGYLSQAQRSCERARDLIQQMLMFSRGQRGSPRAVSLASVVRGALTTLRAGLPGTLELAVEMDESVAAVHVDPAQVEQVLLNLCINARDATGGNGRVRLGVRPLRDAGLHCAGCRQAIEGGFIELYVEDNGHGMAPEVLERIFEPFYSTKETGKGSGMGLAMVHGIVHEHGGHVAVETGPGQGARFRVVWPALAGSVRAAEGEPEKAEAERVPRPTLQGAVLVVDDEETVGEFMRELLETWGLHAACVARPEAALELVRSDPQRYDVVITDHSMAKMTGLELARHLRVVRPDLPIVLYTGQGDGFGADDPAVIGLSAVMRKPIDPQELSQVLGRCLAAGATQ
jgi:PAS domain S-box-containing protein